MYSRDHHILALVLAHKQYYTTNSMYGFTLRRPESEIGRVPHVSQRFLCAHRMTIYALSS
jgi:hypothetical protein